jgi:phosphate transport system protein
VATTRTLFDQELAELKSGVVRMGSMVEQAIAESMRALVDRNNALAKEVIARDQEVNELHRQLRERAFMIMATQQPVARDLRLIVSFQHMVLELERMGDHAVGIARAATTCPSSSLTSTCPGWPRSPKRRCMKSWGR